MPQNDQKSMKHRSIELIGQLEIIGYNYKDFSRKCQEKSKKSFENGGNDAIRRAGKSGRGLRERSCKMYAVFTYSG